MRGNSHYPPYELNVVTGRTMAQIDRTAIETRGISGLFLMEQAGQGTAEGMLNVLPSERLRQTTVLCGKGNNGGDGFVIARHLAKAGFHPRVALLGETEHLAGDARTNYLRMLQEGVPLWECASEERWNTFLETAAQTRVWVDALLGTGVRGAPRGLIAQAISAVNDRRRNADVVSVDIPSGVEADTGRVEGEAIYADWVYTMGLPKIGSLLPPGLNYGRRLVVLDIGFPRDLIAEAESPAQLLSAREISNWLPRRDISAHKGSQGHLLVVAGSRGMTGAALMSAKAALVTGAGLLTAACPKSLLPIYASGVWEMMTRPVQETEAGSFSEKAFEELFSGDSRWSAVVIGPGLGRHPSSQDFVRRVIREVPLPVVIDGDGLSAVTKEDLQQRPWDWAATPHPGEMARLFHATVSEIQSDRLGYAARLAESENGVAVLKGPKTVVAGAGRKPYINPTGTPAMASGGMGDVLTGVVGALLAKRIPTLEAAACAVFLHGLAAERAENEMAAEAVTATQVISHLQPALHDVRQAASA
ncbi:MAG: NAD(P)H-hydrate dehydratase [Candidatus Omnitrophica bacterium]|nr:NAD(P)H-hydrate dehydratase [Candidatus Omnitrophota bacterium]